MAIDGEGHWPDWSPTLVIAANNERRSMMGVWSFLAVLLFRVDRMLKPLLKLVCGFAKVMKQAG
jgi:hypothetical protein